MVNPSRDLDQELRRLEFKVEAGAEFAVTRPVFDVPRSNASFKRVEPLRLPIIVGIWPFESALNAEFMANEVPGVTVPDALVERMRRATSAEAAAAEGVRDRPGDCARPARGWQQVCRSLPIRQSIGPFDVWRDPGCS